jgi:predicted permease
MGVWSRLRKTFRGDRHIAEIQEELQFHLDMDAADGHDARTARLRLGNVTRLTEETRAVGIIEWIDSAFADARYGARQLRRTPALSIAVVLSLAIGLGANTAIFSLVDAAILRPLPVNDAGSLVIVEWTNEGFPPHVENINGDFRRISAAPTQGFSLAGSTGRNQGSSVSANIHRRLAREQTDFEALIGIADPDLVAIALDGSPAEQVHLQYVSSNFFQGAGIIQAVGRPFREDDDRVGQEPVVVVSHRFWVSRLAAAPGAVDRTVRINNVPARIVGVAKPGFFSLMAGQWTDVYAPLAARVAFQPRVVGGVLQGENDADWWVRQMARLKPGIPEQTARAQLDGLFRNLVVPDDTHKIPELVTLPGKHGFNWVSARDAGALRILMLLVGLLLLIVCANVANLLLSRSVGRRRESAVRLALGAARTRLFRQHLIESGVLALLGGGAGLALGYILAQAIHNLFQTGRDAGSAFDLHIDPRVLAYTALLSLLTAVVFGLAPALRSARTDLGDSLKTQTRSIIGGRLRLPRFLVSIQIALCLAALVGAGLLGRSLRNLERNDLGFDRRHLVYASTSPGRAGYSPERIPPYVDRVRDELAKLPGVARVSTVSTRLLSGGGNNGRMHFPGREWTDEYRANLNTVSDGFFETLGIPLLAGRTIERRDMRPDSDVVVVVVDDAFVKKYYPNENPLGRRFGAGPTNTDRYLIVGVVGSSRYNTMRSDAYPTVYEPYRPGGTIHFAIRTTVDGAGLADSIRKAVASVDAAVPMTEFHTQTGLIERSLRTERLLGFLSGAFGVIALALSAIGLGGLLAYAVARRTNEIGVRIALGAARSDVVRMVIRDSLSMVVAGVLLGLPCAYAVANVLQTMLFRLQPLDAWTTTLSFAALLSVALVAAWIPARRAARIDPIIALREG